MAQEIQHGGAAVVHGIDGSSAITISGYATFIGPQSGNVQQNFEETITKDGQGADANWIAKNEHYILRIKFTPSGANRAAAAAVAVFVAPHAAVTIANARIAALNGAWQNINGATIDLGSEKVCEVELQLRRYTDSTQNTGATAAALS